jgi:hypothetical protein
MTPRGLENTMDVGTQTIGGQQCRQMWQHMSKDVSDARPPKPSHIGINHPSFPIPPISNDLFVTVTMDFITKLPISGGCDSILTITDYDCTKAVILVPCKEAMSSKEFLELYRERAFPYTGIPK